MQHGGWLCLSRRCRVWLVGLLLSARLSVLVALLALRPVDCVAWQPAHGDLVLALPLVSNFCFCFFISNL